MRTTVTLTPEADGVVRRLMAERGLTFKDAVNTAITTGARAAEVDAYRVRPADLGAARVPLDRALALAGDLEDEELVRRMETGS